MIYVSHVVITFIKFPQKLGRECRPFFLNGAFFPLPQLVFINFTLLVLGSLFMIETYLISLIFQEL